MFSKVLNMCYIATPGRLYESRDCRDTSATTGNCQAYQGCADSQGGSWEEDILRGPPQHPYGGDARCHDPCGWYP